MSTSLRGLEHSLDINFNKEKDLMVNFWFKAFYGLALADGGQTFERTEFVTVLTCQQFVVSFEDMRISDQVVFFFQPNLRC